MIGINVIDDTKWKVIILGIRRCQDILFLFQYIAYTFIIYIFWNSIIW